MGIQHDPTRLSVSESRRAHPAGARILSDSVSLLGGPLADQLRSQIPLVYFGLIN